MNATLVEKKPVLLDVTLHLTGVEAQKMKLAMNPTRNNRDPKEHADSLADFRYETWKALDEVSVKMYGDK